MNGKGRGMKLSFSVTEFSGLREVFKQRPSCKSAAMRQSDIIQGAGVMTAEQSKLLQFTEAAMQKRMFRLLEMWNLLCN